MFLVEDRPQEEKIHIYNLAVNKSWYIGNVSILERFYKDEEESLNPYLRLGGTSSHSFFWKKVLGKFHKVHSGLPRLITNRMRDLVNSGFELVEDEELIELRVNDILTDNNFDSLFDNGVVDESWAGYTGYKLSFDKKISKFPLIEMVKPEQLRVFTNRGRINKYVITFEDSELFADDDNTYTLEEIYTKGATGAEITYKAYRGADKKETVTQTKYEDEVLTNFFNFPIFLKNNTSTSAQSDIYGESDYSNSISLFDDLDENHSQLSHKIRHASPKRFIDESLITTDADNNPMGFNDFELDHIVTSEQLDPTKQALLQQHTVDIQAVEYLTTRSALESEILANSGLSPVTIGNAQASGLNNSADTLRERERLTIRTRRTKHKLWKQFLENFISTLLSYEDYMNDQPIGEYDIKIEFNPFEDMSEAERVEILGNKKINALITVRDSLEQLNPELTEEEIDAMVLKVKVENNINILPDEAPPVEEVTEDEEVIEETETEEVEETI